ncbi:hypothetical protein ElyMa_006782600 [Elysia marginata]|uniref:Uncharacterized protein n=1 Tax=Elysia marginata TaxID=1093978 RepID=A0AAV4J0P8_9GAST|nr:hypothetical protein ElyMa_006782600 [Elysia marginata]
MWCAQAPLTSQCGSTLSIVHRAVSDITSKLTGTLKQPTRTATSFTLKCQRDLDKLRDSAEERSQWGELAARRLYKKVPRRPCGTTETRVARSVVAAWYKLCFCKWQGGGCRASISRKFESY